MIWTSQEGTQSIPYGDEGVLERAVCNVQHSSKFPNIADNNNENDDEVHVEATSAWHRLAQAVLGTEIIRLPILRVCDDLRDNLEARIITCFVGIILIVTHPVNE